MVEVIRDIGLLLHVERTGERTSVWTESGALWSGVMCHIFVTVNVSEHIFFSAFNVG